MKVALLQQEFKGTKEATIAKTLELIAEAKKGGADLVVCQELHQTQYF
ncbi:MAG: carbon-nitrogen hydrolase, partial [Campylobacter concisus]|nr:carbon-nitrogen hydrolase [Campylobacter concisus]